MLKKFSAEEFVDLIAMPKLVEYAESGEFNSKEIEDYLKKQLQEFNLNDYSEIVLGCTHFPFFKEEIKKVVPQSISIIDGSKGVANRLKDILQKNDLLGNNNLKIEYYYSGRKVEDCEKLEKILKR